MEEEGAEAFSKALMNLKKLTILNLNLKDTMISNDGVKFLAKGLRSQTNLKNMELNLQQFFFIFFFFSEKIFSCKFDKTGAKHLEKLLKKLPQLKVLKLILTGYIDFYF